MKKELKNIKGFRIGKLPLVLKKVEDLIYFEGPLMSVYSDKNSMPFIVDWADSDSEINRWMIYQVERKSLAQYINREISHFQLLNSPANDIIFIVDKKEKEFVENCIICTSNKLPYEYLPQNDIFFEQDDFIDIDKVISFFKLDELHRNADIDSHFDILEEAKKENNELINLHIKSDSRNVGPGKIYSSILGQVLTNYHNLSEATAINLFDLKEKLPPDEKTRRKKGELKNIKELAELEFIYAKAGSFSVFLRPIVKKLNLFDQQTSSERITTEVFKLFEASDDIERLKEIKSGLNQSMLTSYNTFLKEIKEQDISIGVQYANPQNEFKLSKKFNAKNAHTILSNLNSLEYEDKKEVKTKGYFKALDSITASFKFEDNEGYEYQGKFSNQLKEGIYQFNLQDYYMVTIDIIESKKSGKKKISEKEIMVSCIIEE